MLPPRSLMRQFPTLKKCFEARVPVNVEVTEADNKQGNRGDAMNCAMARAVCREFGADVAVIGMSYSYVIKGDTAIRYKTPVSLSREIVAFDRARKFEPGTYGLAVPSQGETRQGARDRVAANARKRKRSGVKPPGASRAPKRVVLKRHRTSGGGVRKL